MSTPVSDTARNQGAINFLMLMVCAAVVWLAMQAVFPALYGEDCHEAESAILDGAMWAFVIGFHGRWIYGLIRGGRVLLDCGPSPYRWINVAVGIVVLGMYALHLDWSESLLNEELWHGLMIASFLLTPPLCRLQIRENGVFNYWGLLRWRKIVAYRWAEEATLVLSMRGLSFRRVAISFPVEQRQAVEELLAKFCPARPRARSSRALWVAAAGMALLVGGGAWRWECVPLAQWQSQWILTRGIHADVAQMVGAFEDLSLVAMGLGAALVVLAAHHWTGGNTERL